MSRFGKLLIGLLLAGFAAFAQDSAQTAPSTTQTPTATPKRNHVRGDRSEQKLKRLSQKLALTDDQKERIRPILRDEEKQLTDLESDNALTQQQKHRKTREIRMSSRSQMDAILTPEQKEKLPNMRAGNGGRHHQRQGTMGPLTRAHPHRNKSAACSRGPGAACEAALSRF